MIVGLTVSSFLTDDERLHFLRKNVGVDVWQAAPFLLGSIMFKILLVVNPVVLVIGWIMPFFEVNRLMMLAACFVVFSECSLSILQSLLFEPSRFHVSVLKSTLVWSPSGVGWSHYILKAFREVIDLESVLTHVVHMVRH